MSAQKTYVKSDQKMPYERQDYEKKVGAESIENRRRRRAATRRRKEAKAEAMMVRRSISAAVLMSLIVLAYIVLGAMNDSLKYQIDELQGENMEISSQIEELKLDRETSVSSSALAEAAAKKLNMRQPTGSSMVRIRRGGKTAANFMETMKNQAF